MAGVAIVGLGAIGSHLAPLAARLPGVDHIVLVDFDCYEARNLDCQFIEPSALGRPKVEYQAERIAAVNPNLSITTYYDWIENLPLLALRGMILVACVDRRSARQTINRFARRLDCPWLNAAVDAPSLFSVQHYIPSSTSPCLECGWDQVSYDLLEQTYPCDGGETRVPATRAPAELGAMAAASLAVELRALTDPAARESGLRSAQLMIDTATNARSLMRFRFNPRCRFDHQSWALAYRDLDPQSNSFADLFQSLDFDDPAISVEGHEFATRLDCAACGRRTPITPRLYGRLGEEARRCVGCGGPLFAPGFYRLPALTRSALSPATLALPLAAFGFRRGDVLSVNGDGNPPVHLALAKEDDHA